MIPTRAQEVSINLSAVDGIAFLVNRLGIIFSSNDSFRNFLGYSPTFVNDKSLADFIIPAEKPAARKFIQKALNGIPAYGHLAFLTHDGQKRIGKVTAVPFFEDSGIAGATCFVQDVTETVNLNRDIYDQEQRLKAIFYHEPDCVAVLALDGTLIDLNPAGLAIFQAAREQIIGTTFFSHIVEAYREKYIATHTLVCESAFHSLQFQIKSLEGNLRWVEANMVPLKDKRETIYATLSVIRDISEKKAIEELLRKQEERLESVKRIARIGYWEYDFQQHKGFATDGLYEIYGLKRSECPEITFDVFLGMVHPDDKEKMEKNIQNLVNHPMVEEEHRLVRTDGKTIYIHHSGTTTYDSLGQPICISGAVQDITERKESERQLLLSEQKFKSLVHNGSDLIVILDEQGFFSYVSPSAKNIAGYEPSDLLGRNAFELIHPDDHKLVQDELKSVIETVNSGQATPHRFLNAAGEWMWLESKGVNLMHDTNIQGIIINSRDITDRKKLQEQLDRELANHQKEITSAVIKAQEGERSQLGQELHDNVNQVLTTIKLYNEMLLDGLGSPNEILKKSIHHLQGCINEIRSISKRLSAPTLGKISLSDSIQELIDSVNLTKKINIHFSIVNINNSAVSQDIHLTLYRIIQEQLNNIIKHAEAKNVSIDLVNCHKEISLTICDDGKGFNVDAKRSGIGITNIITRAANINGKVLLQSQTGKGCTLKLTFPSLV